jgi:hypothetical protein
MHFCQQAPPKLSLTRKDSHLPAPQPSHEVFELRQYTLHPGRRDALIALFEREFIIPQQKAGMRILGQFLDLDSPDRFVWFRSFPGMAERKDALGRFYGGPVWKAHRDEANATMIDSDDVLLLRIVNPNFPFPSRLENGLLELTVHDRVGAAAEWLDSLTQPLLTTERAENTFPALPIRLNEDVIVSFSLPSLPLPVKQRLRLQPTTASQLR